MRSILKTKKNTMKKLFAILAVASIMTACTNGDTDKPADASSATDTTKNPAADAAKIADTANKMMEAAKDTGSKMMNAVKDTVNKMMDKAGDKMKEAGDKMKEAGNKAADKAKEAVKH